MYTLTEVNVLRQLRLTPYPTDLADSLSYALFQLSDSSVFATLPRMPTTHNIQLWVGLHALTLLLLPDLMVWVTVSDMVGGWGWCTWCHSMCSLGAASALTTTTVSITIVTWAFARAGGRGEPRVVL